MVEEARSFAEKAHEGQFRKGTKRPYIVHPLEVAKIVSTMTDDEEMISAALLHDTLEDCRQVTKEQIKEAFGERVLEMVRQESEDKSKNLGGEKKYDNPTFENSAERGADDRSCGQAVQYPGY